MENFTFQFHPQHKKIRELIKTNTIGVPHTLSAKYGFTLPFSKKIFDLIKNLEEVH